jgi:hypothetical protein
MKKAGARTPAFFIDHERPATLRFRWVRESADERRMRNIGGSVPVVLVETEGSANISNRLHRHLRELRKSGRIAFGPQQQRLHAFTPCGGFYGLARGFPAQCRDLRVDPPGPVVAQHFDEVRAHLGMLQEFFLAGIRRMFPFLRWSTNGSPSVLRIWGGVVNRS